MVLLIIVNYQRILSSSKKNSSFIIFTTYVISPKKNTINQDKIKKKNFWLNFNFSSLLSTRVREFFYFTIFQFSFLSQPRESEFFPHSFFFNLFNDNFFCLSYFLRKGSLIFLPHNSPRGKILLRLDFVCKFKHFYRETEHKERFWWCKKVLWLFNLNVVGDGQGVDNHQFKLNIF